MIDVSATRCAFCCLLDPALRQTSQCWPLIPLTCRTIGQLSPFNYSWQHRGTVLLRVQELDDSVVLLCEYIISSDDVSYCPRGGPADVIVAKQLEKAINMISCAGVSPHEQSLRHPRPCCYRLAARLGRLGSKCDLRCPENVEFIRKES